MSGPGEPSDLPCGGCSKPILLGPPVLFRDGRMFHLTCFTPVTRLEAGEREDRVAPTFATATAPAPRVARFRGGGTRGRRIRACAVCGGRLRSDDLAWAPDGKPVHVGCPAPASRAVATPPA
jgi:hypothetical protein